jgi:hypothetical protein
MLALLRRKIADTDVTASYSDEQLWTSVDDARVFLAVKQVKAMTNYVVELDPNLVGFGITPAPDDDHAYIIVLQATYDILRQRYHDLVDSGAIGVAWRSGLEEESSIQAEKAFKDVLTELRRELDALIIIQNRSSSATRPL